MLVTQYCDDHRLLHTPHTHNPTSRRVQVAVVVKSRGLSGVYDLIACTDFRFQALCTSYKLRN